MSAIATIEPAPAIEFDQLIKRCLGNLALMERAVDLFVAKFPEELEQFEKALAEGRRSDLPRLVHRMKGSASNVSAVALAGELAAIESLIVDEQWDDVADASSSLLAEWDRLLCAIG